MLEEKPRETLRRSSEQTVQQMKAVQKKQRKQKKRLRTVITLLAFVALLLAAALAWLFAESVLQARPIPALTKALRTALPLAVLAGICYNFCVYFAAEPQLMGQNPALYENVSRLVQFWL